MKSKILVGHDSEVFATRLGVGMFPMIGQVGGTKHHPLPVPGGTLQEDNVSIEMAINPTADVDEFIRRTYLVMKELENKIKKAGCSAVIKPTVEFRQDVLDTFNPESKEQGCDPDYNIYTCSENQYPSMELTTLRHGSGHLHVDCLAAVEKPIIMQNLVMLHDMLIKAPQWLLEGNVARNDVQGALGNYRPKKYGVEYRSSSNIILTDEKILRHAFKWAQKSSARASIGQSVSKEHIHNLKEAMSLGNKNTVRAFIDYYNGEEIQV